MEAWYSALTAYMPCARVPASLTERELKSFDFEDHLLLLHVQLHTLVDLCSASDDPRRRFACPTAGCPPSDERTWSVRTRPRPCRLYDQHHSVWGTRQGHYHPSEMLNGSTREGARRTCEKRMHDAQAVVITMVRTMICEARTPCPAAGTAT